MFSTLIIDDERDQQVHLSGLIEKHFPQYNILDICSTVDEGIEKAHKLNPQLVFLDVMLPPKTGFDFLEGMKQINFEVIFSTSYEKYALNAIKLSAVDFLLKPFGLDDLRPALQKFEKRFTEKASLSNLQLLLENVRTNTSDKMRIALPVMSGYSFVQISDIIRCQSDDMYTTFFFADKSKLMVSRSMKECEELLSDYGFFRTHTSHMINLRYLKEYIRGDGGQVKLTDGSVIDVSRRRKEEFLAIIDRL